MRSTKLNASDLDSIIQIEQYTTVADGMGGNARTWAVLYPRVFAKATLLKGVEQPIQGEIQPLEHWRFEIRNRTGITTNMRIVHQGKRLNIRRAAPDTTRDRMLIIEATAGDANG